MDKRAKKDVKLLLMMVLVLSVFNMISAQFFLYDAGHQQVGKELGGQTLPSEARRTNFVVAKPSGAGKTSTSDNTESNVYQYVNNQLKKYGYDTLNTNARQENNASLSSDSQQENDPVIHLGGSNQSQSNNQNQESSSHSQNDTNSTASDETESSGQQSGQQNDSGNTNESEQNNGNSGLPTVPPSNNGSAAQPVEGKVKFGVKSGLG